LTAALSIFPVNRNWLLIALLAGLLIALLPPIVSLSVLGVTALGILSLIDLRVALLVTLTVAPLKTLIETESRLSLPLDVGQLALAATLGIWLARSIAQHRCLNLIWTPIYVPIILFTLAASLSLWVALSPGSTLSELLKWVEILAVIALVVSLMGEHGPDGIVAALIVAGAVQAIIGLYQFGGGSGAPHLWILDFRYFRAFGSFGQPNPFGAFMGLTLPIAISAASGASAEAWTAYRADHLQWRAFARPLLFVVGAGIIGVGLLVSWSRGAWIGFAAAALALILFAPRRRVVGLGLVGLVTVGAVIALLAGLVPASALARFSDVAQDLTGFEDVRGALITDANYAVLERFAHWQAALSMANDAPWLGVGFGNYEAAYPRYALMNWPFALGHAHNYYLNLLAETGVIGLSAYLIAWIMIVALTLRALQRQVGFRRGLALGLLGAWTHLAVHSLFDKLYVNNLFLHIGVMLGLIGGLLVLVSAESETTVSTVATR
jgi:putative inorganic carbon (hco3(-)) transporter